MRRAAKAAYKQTKLSEYADQSYNINIVGNAEIAADLILFYVGGIDDDNDLRIVFKL